MTASTLAPTRGVTRIDNVVIRIDWQDRCAALQRDRDSLYLRVQLLTEQRATLYEDLRATEATAAALLARVAELEAGERRRAAAAGLRPRPSRLAGWWGAATLAWDRVLAHLRWAAS